MRLLVYLISFGLLAPSLFCVNGDDSAESRSELDERQNQIAILSEIIKAQNIRKLKKALKAGLNPRSPASLMAIVSLSGIRSLNMLNLLLEYGMYFNVRSGMGQYPLNVLVHNKLMDEKSWSSAIVYFLNHGAQTATVEPDALILLNQAIDSPLLYAIATHNQDQALNILTALHETDQLSSEQIKNLQAACIMSAAQGQLEILKHLITLFAEHLLPNCLRTAFIRAAFAGHENIVRWIYQQETAAIHSPLSSGWNDVLSEALLQAAIQRNATIVRFILVIDANNRLGLNLEHTARRINFFLQRQLLSDNERKQYSKIAILLRDANEGRTAQLLKIAHYAGLPQLPREISAAIGQFIQGFFP